MAKDEAADEVQIELLQQELEDELASTDIRTDEIETSDVSDFRAVIDS